MYFNCVRRKEIHLLEGTKWLECAGVSGTGQDTRTRQSAGRGGHSSALVLLGSRPAQSTELQISFTFWLNSSGWSAYT